jgi:hypothetical protein
MFFNAKEIREYEKAYRSSAIWLRRLNLPAVSCTAGIRIVKNSHLQMKTA